MIKELGTVMEETKSTNPIPQVDFVRKSLP
jgi:hypothetical protein